MNKNMEIDFCRQAILQTIQQEYIKNPTKYVGSKNDFMITSFYEHLTSNEEVNRYVETVRELTNQQNRVGLIANGVIVAPSSPTITNINSALIIPMDFTLNIRTTIEDVELVKDTLDHCIELLKGRKQDIAELDSGELFMVGTLGNNINGKPLARNGDFIGEVNGVDIDIDSFINNKVSQLETLGFVFENKENNAFVIGSYFYFSYNNVLRVAVYDYDSVSETNKWLPKVDNYEDYPNIIFPPEHNSFVKYKLSMAFDSFRLSEPREINAKDYVDLSFGGSATLVSANVMLGNELTKLGIKRVGVKTKDGLDTTNADSDYHWLEPLELPSGNGASVTANQLISNKFLNNSHTDGLTITRQYTFVYDYDNEFLQMLFMYGRYGLQEGISPNMIYELVEIYSSWGNIKPLNSTQLRTIKAKLVENVDIENNESDVLTLSITMQIQGDND